MDSPYSPPLSEQSNQKPRHLGKWIFGGCLGILGVFILLISSCFMSIRSSRNNMSPACVQYLQLLGDKKYDEAYSHWGDDGKSAFSIDQHRALVTDALGKLGSIKHFEVQSVFSGVDQKGQWGRLVYKTQFEKTTGTIMFNLRSYSGTYKITGINIQMTHDYSDRPISKSS